MSDKYLHNTEWGQFVHFKSICSFVLSLVSIEIMAMFKLEGWEMKQSSKSMENQGKLAHYFQSGGILG